MVRIALKVLAVGLVVATSGLSHAAHAASTQEGDGQEAGVAPADETSKLDAARTARAYAMMPFAVSPRVGDHLVTGHVWGGYDGGARGAIGEAVVDGRVSRFVAVRVGASAPDLWGRTTAILGARLGILRDGAAPFDLGVGVFYQPQSFRGDGLVTANVAFGKTIGRLTSQASIGYGQDPEADDGLGVTSLGALFRVTERAHAGVQSRARLQLWSTDQKYTNLQQPLLDFMAGPLLAYSLGRFDVMAQAGLAGLMLGPAPGAAGERRSLQLGPMAMLGVAVAM